MPRPGAPGVTVTVEYDVLAGSTILELALPTEMTRVYSRPSCSIELPTHT